ncbi:UNVERIFIED_ORG: hypothetical protein ABIB63_001271 [Xanthomonas axonopodis]
MADHIVDGGIEYELETILPLARRPCVELIDNHALDKRIEFQRAATFQRQAIQRIEYLRQ